MLWLMELWALLVCVQQGGTSQQDTCQDFHSPATGHILPPSRQNVSSRDGLQHETLFQHTPTVDPWDQLLPTSCPPQIHELEFPVGKWSHVKQHQDINKAAGKTKTKQRGGGDNFSKWLRGGIRVLKYVTIRPITPWDQWYKCMESLWTENLLWKNVSAHKNV